MEFNRLKEYSLFEIITKIKQELENKEKITKSYIKELENEKKKGSFFKYQEKDLKECKKVLADLAELKNKIQHLGTLLNLKKKYKIKPEFKEIYLKLQGVMPTKEFKYFEEVLNNEIVEYNKQIHLDGSKTTIYEDLKKEFKKTKQSFKKSDSMGICIVDGADIFRKEEVFLEIEKRINEFYSYSGLEGLIALKEKKLEDFHLSAPLSKIDNFLNGGNEFSEFINNSDKKIDNILHNFKRIKESFLTREKLSYTNALMKEMIYNLESKFLDTKEVLEYLIKRNEKEINKINKYLNKYDLAHLDSLYAKEEIQKEHDSRLEEYKAYAYQLERAKAAGDMEKVKEIEESMQRIANYGNLLDSEKMVSAANAKVEYIDDSNVKESDKKTRDKMQENPDYILIAKDYIRYLGGLKDKKDKISFAEFGKQKYNAIVNEIILPEELIDEIKRKSK